MADARIAAGGATTGRPLGRWARAALLLATASVVAALASVLVVALVLRADFLTGAADLLARLALRHGVLAAAAAASPVVASLLVGYAYMQRGIRRRVAERAAASASGGGAARGPPGRRSP